MNPTNLEKRLTSISNSSKRVCDLYTLLWYEELWYQAYQNIYSNHGAFTKGIGEDTLDVMDKERIRNIILSIKNKTYEPTPVRRVLIPKSNGKMRPLGIPNGTDKLVQEVCRIILETIYEPKFSEYSHGFRPNKSCHTALKEIYNWTSTKWWIEFDIEKCFDNIDHDILLSILENKIDDKRFLSIIRKFLKAGYIENWKYEKTISGTPQGGIISPILANIYLNELDNYIVEKCNKINFTKNERQNTTEYYNINTKLCNARRDIDSYKHRIDEILKYVKLNLNQLAENDSEIWKCINKAIEVRRNSDGYATTQSVRKELKYITDTYELNIKDLTNLTWYQILVDRYKNAKEILDTYPKILRSLKCTDTSNGLERLHYVRYADDFLLGYIGTKNNADSIFNEIKNFLKVNLKLNISEEKSKVKDKCEDIKYLGYYVTMPSYTEVRKENSDGVLKRINVSKPKFKVPVENMIRFVQKNKYGSYVENTSTHRSFLINFEDIEIIKQYNAELRGLMNYYQYAMNCKQIIGKVQWLAHFSLIKTLAAKHKCNVPQIFKNNIIKTKFNLNKTGKVWFKEIKGTNKEIEVFNIRDIDSKNIFDVKAKDTCYDKLDVKVINLRNSAITKMINDECMMCGSKEQVVLHHTNPIKNISKTDPLWKKVQKMRLRKVVALCNSCHIKTHSKS